jgi:predicted Rossmann-fold nucleotide-binding protein
MYITPQTPDGEITQAAQSAADAISVEVRFNVSDAFISLTHGRQEQVIFASRSRFARLGIEICPVSPVRFEGKSAYLTATVRSVVPSYNVAQFLPDLLCKGLRVGRLVFCPQENRLPSEAVAAALLQHRIQLPAGSSVDVDGRLVIPTHRCLYSFQKPLTFDDISAIAARVDGIEVLNRLQTRVNVQHLFLAAGDGLITSCSMFLHEHYVVLDSAAAALGQHLQAVVLDPISTRGTRVFLEFWNHSASPILNPMVVAYVYSAINEDLSRRRWFTVQDNTPQAPDPKLLASTDYEALAAYMNRIVSPAPIASYYDRPVIVVAKVDDIRSGKAPLDSWTGPSQLDRSGIHMIARPENYAREPADCAMYGTDIISKLPPNANATLLLDYFPNLVEHTAICDAACQRKVKRLAFRRASFEHGPFFSDRDHGRLADYQTLRLEIYWCNDERKHVAYHAYRGLRGFFVRPDVLDRFYSALIFAVYGSTWPLDPDSVRRLDTLLEELQHLFGSNVAILTGGGPGAMSQVTELAHARGMLVGASFIETIDQPRTETVEFYQTFQSKSRQDRQRWFEIASFHICCSGGLGTLEEIGLTLTDMKLGVFEPSPFVFFGSQNSRPYWDHLRAQIETMVAAQRAPAWLQHQLLFTSDPKEVTAFYRRNLQLA